MLSLASALSPPLFVVGFVLFVIINIVGCVLAPWALVSLSRTHRALLAELRRANDIALMARQAPADTTPGERLARSSRFMGS